MKIFNKQETKQMLLFIIDEFGRTLTEKSRDNIMKEFFEIPEYEDVNARVANGSMVNDREFLLSKIKGRDTAEWDIIYMHASKDYPPALLNEAVKTALIPELESSQGTSAEVIYNVLVAADAYKQFD